MDDYWMEQRDPADRHFEIQHLITADDEYGGNLYSVRMVERLPEHATPEGRVPTRVWFNESCPLGDVYAKETASVYFEFLQSFNVGHILLVKQWRDSGPNLLKEEVIRQFDIDDKPSQGEFQ